MGAIRRIAWPLFVVGAVVALVAPGLAPGRLLAWRDSLRIYAPLRPIIAEALREGRLPLWDPYDATGVPLFAQLIHGVLHPVSVGLALAAPGAPLDALLVAYLLVAALGAYAAARTLEVERPFAAAAAIGYAGSGYLLGSTGNLVFLAGAASLPWLLAAGRRVGQGARLSGVALSLAVAATALSGDVHATLVGCALALALALHAGGAAALPRCLAGVSIGALLAAVQLLPSWRFFPLTDRSLALDAAVRQRWALSPWRLPELLAPGVFGGRPRLLPVVYQALDPGSALPVPFAASVYVGVALLAAAVAAARLRQARPLAVAAPLLLWLAMGHWLGAEQLLHPVPVWGALRYSEKLVAPLTLVIALLAGLGAPRLAAAAPGRWLGPGAAAVGLAAALCAVPGLGGAAFAAVLPPAASEAGRAQAVEGLLHLSLGLAALAAARLVARRAPRAYAPTFAALVLAQALAAAPFALHPSPSPTPLPPVPEAPPPGPRVHTPELRASRDGLPGRLEEEAALGLPGFNVNVRMDNVELYSGLNPRRAASLWAYLGELPTGWRRYGLTHLILPAGPLGPVGASATVGARYLGESGRAQVWSVPHRAWASFAPSASAVTDPGEALRLTMRSILVGSGDVIVEAERAPPTSPGRVLSVARGAEAIAVEAEADGPALLVVNDAWWPGWAAEIDGAPAPVLAADGLVRAVPFPPGRHRLVMRYQPPEVDAGLALSGLGLALLAAWAAWEEAARRARRGPAPP